jgi:hypothetical protein
LIIDKSVFPRDKLCGGLVTPRSKKIFESVFARSWNNSLFNSSDLVEFHAFDQLLATISGYCTLYFTMRLNFDAYLINLAPRANLKLRVSNIFLILEKSIIRFGKPICGGMQSFLSLFSVRLIYKSQETLGFEN